MNRERGRQFYFSVVAALKVLMTPCIKGQTGNEPVTVPGSADDSLKCVDYVSWYKAAMNEGNISGALQPWRQALAGCPSVSEELYTDGELIYRSLFDITGEPEYIDSMVMILTQRTYYYNNKPSNDLHKA